MGLQTHIQALPHGDLADDLADGAGRGADEDRVSLLGLPDLMQRAVRRHARHAERAEICGQRHAGLLVDDLDLRRRAHGRVRLGAPAPDQHEAALLDALAVALQHSSNDADADHRRPRLHRRRVRLDRRVAHPPPLAGVECRVEVLRREPALRWRRRLVEPNVFHRQVLARHRPAHRDGLVHEGFVLDHGAGVGGVLGLRGGDGMGLEMGNG